MALLSYKCPNCGGGLKFDPASQKFKCEYCLSSFTKEEMKELEARETKEREDDGRPDDNSYSGNNSVSGTEEDAGSPESAKIYMCPSCGAEIVTDDTTAATFCYYCHNPVVLSGRLSGEFLPDYVILFAMNKQRATEIFLNWIGKKKFVPRSFFSEDQIEKFTGVYFPYLMYSCTVEGKMTAEGEQLNSWVSGKIRYTEHKKYQIERAGELDVKNVTRNALSKSNKELIEAVLPFDMEKMQPFSMGYLSGFQAEKRDMDGKGFTPEVEQEVKNYTIENLQSSISGYSSVSVKNSDTKIKDPMWKYALLPVWILTYRDGRNDKLYYFAMNGQTGKTCGKLPVDKGKLAVLFMSIFLPVFAFFLIGGWFL